MDRKEIVSHIDHTVLAPEATWNDVKTILDEAVEHGAASACIPPSFVKEASDYVGDSLPICTVIGFPNGYQTTATKVFETEDAVSDGASEIDMVINIGWAKAGRFDALLEEIKAVRAACPNQILKVIIETSALTDDEIITLCQVVTNSTADYVKTSTGFGAAGATKGDIALMAANIGPHLKIKAAGGIRTLEDARVLISLGADRIGSSQIIKSLSCIDCITTEESP